MKKTLYTLIAILGFVNLTKAQMPSYVPTDSLIGWWGFNGNANDESGNNNNGTVNGATLTIDRFGNAGKAYSFDGVNDKIDLPLNLNGSLLNLTKFTFSGFINKNSFQNNQGGIFSNWKAGPLIDPFGILINTTTGFSASNCTGTAVNTRDTLQISTTLGP